MGPAVNKLHFFLNLGVAQTGFKVQDYVLLTDVFENEAVCVARENNG